MKTGEQVNESANTKEGKPAVHTGNGIFFEIFQKRSGLAAIGFVRLPKPEYPTIVLFVFKGFPMPKTKNLFFAFQTASVITFYLIMSCLCYAQTSIRFTTTQPDTKVNGTDMDRPKSLAKHVIGKTGETSDVRKSDVQSAVSRHLLDGKTAGQYLIERSRRHEVPMDFGILPVSGEIEESLPKPTPDARSQDAYFDYTELPKEFRSAEFLGILPGVTSEDELADILSSPDEYFRENGLEYHIYHDLEGLGDVEVACKNGIVESLMVQLSTPFPAAQIIQLLENELKNIRSIIVPDENGNKLGILFPEKGMTFVLMPHENEKDDDAPEMVSQIGIERVSAEPFVLRGERYLTIAVSKAKWDLSVAVMLDPKNHRAHWLLACANQQLGNIADAAKNCQEAIRLYERQPQYHVTLASLFGDAGQVNEARRYLSEILPLCGPIPHVKAQTECLIGDFYRKGNPPDLLKAINSYTKAIETAATLVGSKNPTQRQLAKETLLNAHLNTALAISSGNMDKKEVAIEQWLSRSEEYAEDLVIKEKASHTHLLRVATTALAIYLESDSDTDIRPYIKEVRDIGKLLISQSDDPIKNQLTEKEMGIAFYNASQVYQIREQYDEAVKLGELANEHLENALGQNENVTDLYRIARVCFRVGAIQAKQGFHKQAVKWYAKAIPHFQRIEPVLEEAEQPRLGEIYVNIGVSYWEIDEKEYAIQISTYGITKLEEAVDDGYLDKQSLVSPYTNLATMFRKLEQHSEADEYQVKARRINQTASKNSNSSQKRR